LYWAGALLTETTIDCDKSRKYWRTNETMTSNTPPSH
jgi:hypothetical protein